MTIAEGDAVETGASFLYPPDPAHAEQFEVFVDRNGADATLWVAGSLRGVGRRLQKLLARFADSDDHHVVIDLANVTEVDADSLDVLAAFYEQAAQAGVAVQVRRAVPLVNRQLADLGVGGA